MQLARAPVSKLSKWHTHLTVAVCVVRSNDVFWACFGDRNIYMAERHAQFVLALSDSSSRSCNAAPVEVVFGTGAIGIAAFVGGMVVAMDDAILRAHNIKKLPARYGMPSTPS